MSLEIAPHRIPTPNTTQPAPRVLLSHGTEWAQRGAALIATIAAGLVFLTYAGTYALVLQLIRTRAQLDRLVSTLLIVGGLLAFFGLLDYLGRDAWLLRWRTTPATAPPVPM